ncbi:MAG: vitamin K epoxide reductase family protein [Candidatus Limnocylindrales bacterium]
MRQAGLLVVLAIAGVVVAADLAAFQLGLIAGPWEPFFGESSRRVLTSDLSRLLPIPDGVLGLAGYLVDLALSAWLLGHPRGSQIAATGLAAIASLAGITAVFLVGYQVLVVGALCTLCLASAGISWLLAGCAIREARARDGHDRAVAVHVRSTEAS